MSEEKCLLTKFLLDVCSIVSICSEVCYTRGERFLKTFNFRLLTVEMKAQPSDASPTVNGNDKPPEIQRGLRIGRMQGRGNDI